MFIDGEWKVNIRSCTVIPIEIYNLYNGVRNRRYVAICLAGVAISTNVFQHISQSRGRFVGRVE